MVVNVQTPSGTRQGGPNRVMPLGVRGARLASRIGGTPPPSFEVKVKA
jgi:hypothetical protein